MSGSFSNASCRRYGGASSPIANVLASVSCLCSRPSLSLLLHVLLPAHEAAVLVQHVPLQQEVPELVGDAEPGASQTMPIIDEDLAVAPDPVGQEGTFAAVEALQAHLEDVEGPRDLDDRDRTGRAAQLQMKGTSQPDGIVDVGEIDPVKLQGMVLRGRVSPSSTSPSPR